jgi:hypothetical protein
MTDQSFDERRVHELHGLYCQGGPRAVVRRFGKPALESPEYLEAIRRHEEARSRYFGQARMMESVTASLSGQRVGRTTLPPTGDSRLDTLLATDGDPDARAAAMDELLAEQRNRQVGN